LRELPADELKIDECFASAMSDSSRNVSLVKSMVDIAHNFELVVVAEGIKDEATADALRDLGCDALQGSLFGETCGAKEFAELFTVEKKSSG